MSLVTTFPAFLWMGTLTASVAFLSAIAAPWREGWAILGYVNFGIAPQTSYWNRTLAKRVTLHPAIIAYNRLGAFEGVVAFLLAS